MTTPTPLAEAARRADEAVATWAHAWTLPYPDPVNAEGIDLNPANRRFQRERFNLVERIKEARADLTRAIREAIGFTWGPILGDLMRIDADHRLVASIREGDKLYGLLVESDGHETPADPDSDGYILRPVVIDLGGPA